jgi:tungstate transport system substrate-binding protein
MAKGFGVERRDVWWNRFVVAGPADDPAGARAASGAKDALARIGAANAPFVSRGDDSGTHKKEKALWGPSPHGSGYQETGQGQGPTLVIASEKRAYVLTDEGTFLRMRAKLALVPLVEGDPALRNPYGAIVVRQGARGADRFGAAKRFVAWLTGPKARAIVTSFLVDGKRAFFLPDETPPPR